MEPPELIYMASYEDWPAYEDAIYNEYLATVAHARLQLLGVRVNVRRMPETKGKGYGFWHLISEAPSKGNRNEDDRIPDLRRCERIRWVAWCIQNFEQDGFSWWENTRGKELHIVIWAEQHDFAVVLAKRESKGGERDPYYLLKTAYCVKTHRGKAFTKERDEYWAARND